MTEGIEKPKSEPGGWELMRAFERVERRLDEASKGFVSVEVHRLLAEDVKETREELTKARSDAAHDVGRARLDASTAIDRAKAEAATAIALIRTELDNAKKTRAQTWTAIGLLAAGGAVTFIYDLISRGAGIGG